MIRPTERRDVGGIMAMIRDSGQFDEDGLAFVGETLDRHLDEPGPALWLTAEADGPVGVAYCLPEPVTSGTWNLSMLWTRRDVHGRGHGRRLVAHVESEAVARAARLLVVETSGLAAFTAARAFYAKVGFHHEATVRDFYGPGDDQLIFTKSLSSTPD